MNEELKKSLTDLIDETLLELEELKKSRFSASEIELKGPGEGIAGKPSNGDLHAKAEDKKDEDEDEDEAEKAEGHNRQADPDGGHHKMDKGETGMPEGTTAKAEGHNRQADPDGGHHKMDKAEDKKDDDKKDDKEPHKDDPEHEEKEKKMAKKLLDMHKGEMKKSQEESESLMKSYVDEKVKPLEDKLSSVLELVKKIADQPVAPKGVTGRVVPLMKSAEDAGESLSKGEVATKLFELKKSGTKVDSLDITRAEMGQDLAKIVEKYKIS